MAISKITLNGVTQMDVTGKTVTSGSMLSGTTALKNDGTDITGNIASKSSSDLTVSDATVTAPAGYYGSAATKTVASGTAGTPTASKGTVSNHSVSVTPSVTNTTGYITGGTKTGTAVTVSASELVSGTKSISANGTGIDVTNYASVDVAVPSGSPNLQAKTNISPTTSSQTITADVGYDALSSVQINAMPSGSATAPASISGTSATVSTGTNTLTLSKTVSVTPSVTAGYISSGTARNSSVSLTASVNTRSSSDLTASGATVTAPAGYYGSAATKSVDAMTLPTAASSSSNSGTRKATIGRSTSTQYINIPVGYNDTKAYYQVSAVANGSATTPATTVTANPSISVSSGGLITATASATKSVTPTVSAGYVSSGTAGTITVSGSNTSQLSTQAAQTLHPSTTDQTIASGKYLTGAQTIKAVKITVLEDALVYSSPISRTATGITFDFNADKSCYVHGTATGVGANGQYFVNQSAIPSYIQLGVEYTVEYSSAKVYFQIWDYSGGNLTKLLETKTNTTFTFPTTMTGALIRLVVENGVTVNETVHPRLYLPRTTGLSGADILEGIILEIGDVDDSDRILSVTGTATRA